ncbi:MAG TPA: lipid-binding SYLF domain-containing protein [Terriglobales bacterium]|nr:lipid-binding SYLF domain-containing protein [Terriglobales bacterium]
MPHTKTSWESMSKRYCQALLIPVFLIAMVVPSLGADKAKDEETLKEAASVLSDMLSSNSIPANVLEGADCVMILPNVKKFGVGIGGSGGRGPMTCRGGKDFNGNWSAPAMYSMGGASVGLQLGGSSTDYVLLIMSQKGVDAVMESKTTLGSDATAAAGPSGATRSGTMTGTDVLTYAKASGLFAGTSLGSATLEPDKDANERLYDKEITAKEIVLQHAVKTTDAGEALISLLNAKLPKHKT